MPYLKIVAFCIGNDLEYFYTKYKKLLCINYGNSNQLL